MEGERWNRELDTCAYVSIIYWNALSGLRQILLVSDQRCRSTVKMQTHRF